MTDGSMSGVFTGKPIGFPPCTPQACMEILDHYGIDCTGKKAVVIGRSLVVGKPAAMMLIKKNATVTVCHTKTVDMPKHWQILNQLSNALNLTLNKTKKTQLKNQLCVLLLKHSTLTQLKKLTVLHQLASIKPLLKV